MIQNLNQILQRKNTLKGKTGTLDFLNKGPKGPTPREKVEKKIKLMPLAKIGTKITLTER